MLPGLSSLLNAANKNKMVTKMKLPLDATYAESLWKTCHSNASSNKKEKSCREYTPSYGCVPDIE
jgi:hypothetical protein